MGSRSHPWPSPVSGPRPVATSSPAPWHWRARLRCDRLADLVPPPRKHRHRYHGVFAPNHKLRRTVTALAIGNVGKLRDAAAGGHADDGSVTGGRCDAHQKPRSHDTSRIAWAKLMARVGEEFPLECPNCGGSRTRPTHVGKLRIWDAVCADARKTPPKRVQGVLAKRHRTADTPKCRCSRTVRQPEDRCRITLGRAILWHARSSGEPLSRAGTKFTQ